MGRTKIVCTIGPASDSPETLDALIEAGMAVARLNASHAGPTELAARLEAIREAERRSGRHVAVLLDLAGAKVRVGQVAEGTVLEPGSVFVLTPEECVGDASRAQITHARLADDVRPGNSIFINDGHLELEVIGVAAPEVRTRVVVGGPLASNKGVNVPRVALSVEAVTRFDRAMAQWALAKDIDYVAQSFVRERIDIHKLRELLGEAPIPIIAKIEKYEAIADIDGVIASADAIMVARGDLGVETSPEDVPVLQRRIVQASRAAGKPVIIATQMLESMTTTRHPSRAEASDVANAVFERVDALMLSAETAVGAHPVLATETMARIATKAEESLAPEATDRRTFGSADDVPAAVSAAVADLAEDVKARAIVVSTQSGATARAVSRHRPNVDIIAATPNEQVARQMMLVGGVTPVVVPLSEDTDEMLEHVVAATREAGLAEVGDRLVIAAGVTTRAPGATDFLIVRRV